MSTTKQATKATFYGIAEQHRIAGLAMLGAAEYANDDLMKAIDALVAAAVGADEANAELRSLEESHGHSRAVIYSSNAERVIPPAALAELRTAQQATTDANEQVARAKRAVEQLTRDGLNSPEVKRYVVEQVAQEYNEVVAHLTAAQAAYQRSQAVQRTASLNRDMSLWLRTTITQSQRAAMVLDGEGIAFIASQLTLNANRLSAAVER